MRKIWDQIVKWILSIPSDKKLHFVAGFIIAAFFAISLGMVAVVVPALFAGFLKEFFDQWTSPSGEGWDWGDLLATVLGGVLCQGFVLLGIWWGFFCA